MTSMMRLQAKCEVSCSAYEGIDAVKEALTEGFKASREECEVSIKLIAHPVFALSCMCRDKELGVNVLDEAMGYIEKAITAAGGSYSLKARPTFVHKDDKEEDEGKRGDGDGDSSDSDSSEDPENQDTTMGDLKADFSDIMKKKVDDDEE